MIRIRTWIAAVAVCACCCPALAGDPDATVTLVAAPGDAPRNVGPDELIVPAPERDRLSIADDGSVLFTAAVRDIGGAILSSEALVVGTAPDDLEILVGVGGELPLTDVPELLDFEVLRIDSARRTPAGDAVVECSTTDGLFQLRTLLTYVDGVADVGAIEFFELAGICPLGRIGDGIFAQPYALNGGVLSFYGSTRLDDCGDDLLRVYRRPAAGDAGVIVLEEGPVPGVPGEELEPFFGGPVANADGDSLFLARYRDSSAVDMLLLAPVNGSPSIVVREGGAIPGTPEEVAFFGPWTIAGDLPDGGPPRVAYVAAGEVLPGPFPVGTTTHVFDSASGSGPVLSTGASHGEHVFAAVPSTGGALVATADTNCIVVVGDTTGPDITAGAVPGVWRFDPDSDTKLALVLYVGGPVPGPASESRTIDRIFSVHVNERGLVAAEVELSDGAQAILLERAGAAERGTFAIAVEQGDDVPGPDGPVKLVGIVNQPSNRPILTRSGADGLQSRFNGRGLFVFRGAAALRSGTAESGVWTVTIEDPGEQCNVDVSVARGSLTVRGDKGGCDITIVSSTEGIVRIDPGDNTTINGERRSWSGTFTKGIDIRMGGGDDRVVLRSTELARDQESSPDVFRDLVVDLGFGVDVLRIEEMQIEGSLVIKPRDGLQESVDVVSCFVARNFQLQAARGKTLVNLTGLDVEGKSKIATGGGDFSKLDLRSCAMDGASIKGNSDGERIDIRSAHFSRSLVIDVGQSNVDFVTVRETMIEKGDLDLRTKRSRAAMIDASDVEVSAGNVRLQTGKEGCNVQLANVSAAKSFDLKTGGTSGAADLNEIALSGIRADRVKLRGVGAHSFAIESNSTIARGVTLKSKKSSLDLFNVSRSTIESGKLIVKSGAGALELRLNMLTVSEGSVAVKSANGLDKVFVIGSSIGGGMKIATRGGNDEIRLESSAVTGDRVLDGGPGTDMLVLDAASTVGGKDVRKGIEP